ncbi:hypothetical protein BH11PLA2_BH11PLA2_51550 [soil metagenome]
MTTTPTNVHEGKVDSVAGDTLNTTCSEGNKHCHTVAKDAKVTCDGKTSKVADLKAGTCVHVTTHKDDKKTATAVESGKDIKMPVTKA